MLRTSCAPLALLGLLLATAPASAQFGSIFGDPPRPPSAVPTRRAPAAPPPGSLQPVTPMPDDDYVAPPPLYPGQDPDSEQTYQAPDAGRTPDYGRSGDRTPDYGRSGDRSPGYGMRSGTGLDSFESQPLPPPPGATVAPATPVPATPMPPANAAIAPAQPGQSAAPGAAPGQQAPAGSAPGHTAPPPAGQNGTGTETAATPPAGAPTGSPASPSADIVTEVEVPTHKVENPIAVFSGLDKITGRITKFEVPLDQTKTFGALQVRPRACYTRPPTEAPNTTGFVEVDETSLQGEVKKLFRGWMFASSPGLHGVEHPIYDVWLTDCKASATMASAPAAGDGHDGAPKAGQGAPDAPVALPRAHPQRRQQQGTARP